MSNRVNHFDFKTEVALGRVYGFETWNKFGYNADVDSAATEIIASWGGAFTYLTTASTLSVVSTSIQDDTGGTGAISIIIYGVNSANAHIIEVLALDGTTPVTTANSYFGVNRLSVYQTGTGTGNAGTINVTATTGGSQQAQMPAGDGTTQQAILHVGANKTFLMDDLWVNANKISGGGTPVVTIKGYAYARVTSALYEVFRKTMDTGVENTFHYNNGEPFIIAQNQILYFTATTNVNDTAVSLRFSGMLCNS